MLNYYYLHIFIDIHYLISKFFRNTIAPAIIIKSTYGDILYFLNYHEKFNILYFKVIFFMRTLNYFIVTQLYSHYVNQLYSHYVTQLYSHYVTIVTIYLQNYSIFICYFFILDCQLWGSLFIRLFYLKASHFLFHFIL